MAKNFVKLALVGSLILSFTISILPCRLNAATADETLKDYSIRVDKPAYFKVVKDQRLSGSEKSKHLIVFESSAKERVEITVIKPVDEPSAQTMLDSEKNTLKKLYAAAQTPYMGDIAQAIGGCPSKFGPMRTAVNFLKNDVETLMGAVKSDFAFGACDQESAKFKGALVSYYDASSKAVWSWRIFVPWHDAKSTLSSKWVSPVLSHFQR